MQKLQKLIESESNYRYNIYEVNSKDVLKQLNWQPLRQYFKRNEFVFMHKIKVSMRRIFFKDCFDCVGSEINLNSQCNYSCRIF